MFSRLSPNDLSDTPMCVPLGKRHHSRQQISIDEDKMLLSMWPKLPVTRNRNISVDRRPKTIACVVISFLQVCSIAFTSNFVNFRPVGVL